MQRFQIWVRHGLGDLIDFWSVPPRWLLIVGILVFVILMVIQPEGCWPNINPER